MLGSDSKPTVHDLPHFPLDNHHIPTTTKDKCRQNRLLKIL